MTLYRGCNSSLTKTSGHYSRARLVVLTDIGIVL